MAASKQATAALCVVVQLAESAVKGLTGNADQKQSHPEWENDTGDDPCAVAIVLGRTGDSTFNLPSLTSARGLTSSFEDYSANCTSNSANFPNSFSIDVPDWAFVDTRAVGWSSSQPSQYNNTAYQGTSIYTTATGGSTTYPVDRSTTTQPTSSVNEVGGPSTTSGRPANGGGSTAVLTTVLTTSGTSGVSLVTSRVTTTIGLGNANDGSNDTDGGGSDVPVKAIVGGVVGGVCLIGIIVISIILAMRKKKHSATPHGSHVQHQAVPPAPPMAQYQQQPYQPGPGPQHAQQWHQTQTDAVQDNTYYPYPNPPTQYSQTPTGYSSESGYAQGPVVDPFRTPPPPPAGYDQPYPPHSDAYGGMAPSTSPPPQQPYPASQQPLLAPMPAPHPHANFKGSAEPTM